MSRATDQERVYAGQPADEAIPRLLDLYGDKLYRLGVYQCGDDDEALDLVQDVFTTAYRNWDQFEGRSAPSTWLYTIATRVCRRRHRRRAGEPATVESLEELLPSHGEPMAVVPNGGPLDETMQREIRDAVDAAIVRLPLHYRMPLLLKEIAELSIEQVAAILGLKEATVKTRVHRARLMLRKEMETAMPKEDLPEADHPREMCLDLLRAKQEAMDRDVDFPIPVEELCERCKSLFASLDLAREVCVQLRSRDGVPEELRRHLARAAATT